jgi:dTDP-glucose pyrophosphorylase
MIDIAIHPYITIRQAMKKLGQSGKKCLVVIDEKNALLGTLSDGDLRKAILKGSNVSESICDIYQPKPTVLVEGKYELTEAKKLFIKNKFDIIPVVDDKGKLSDILLWETVFKNDKNRQNEKLDVPVVIMAGGKGTRLEPFTKVLPKPLVPIHDKPVIEHIIERFVKVGVNEFILTINHKARILKAFIEELRPDYSIDFVEEKDPLGTAGSLKFLEGRFNKPFMVTNCDIIIKADYLDLYAFHQKNSYDITLVASMKNYIIPYGTCELNGEGHLKQINEKPEFDFLANTGLYVLNPDVLHLIPADKLYHITHLIEDAKKSGKRVGVYPIDDDAWIDIGQWAEYQKAVERL